MNQRTWNFHQAFVLVLAFKKMSCQVFCYFGLSVIKMALATAKRTKQQVQRPIISTIVTLICQVFKNNKPLLKFLTDGKLKMPAAFIFEIKGAKKAKQIKAVLEPPIYTYLIRLYKCSLEWS